MAGITFDGIPSTEIDSSTFSGTNFLVGGAGLTPPEKNRFAIEAEYQLCVRSILWLGRDIRPLARGPIPLGSDKEHLETY